LEGGVGATTPCGVSKRLDKEILPAQHSERQVRNAKLFSSQAGARYRIIFPGKRNGVKTLGEARMNRRVPSLLAWLALLLLTAELAAQDKLQETPYYPLQVGTTWHYRAGDGKFTIRVVKHEKVGDKLCALLETRRDGKVVGSEHLTVAVDGVYRLDLTAMLPQHDPNDKSKTLEQPATQALTPPILVLKLPPKKDAKWKISSKSAGQTYRGELQMQEAEVTVPAGKYKTFRVASQDLEISSLKTTITTDFAEGVGMVRQVVEVGDAKVEIVLEKFEAGGK
jgi:hypothetical protein